MNQSKKYRALAIVIALFLMIYPATAGAAMAPESFTGVNYEFKSQGGGTLKSYVSVTNLAATFISYVCFVERYQDGRWIQVDSWGNYGPGPNVSGEHYTYNQPSGYYYKLTISFTTSEGSGTTEAAAIYH